MSTSSGADGYLTAQEAAGSHEVVKLKGCYADIDGFFIRNGFDPQTRALCDKFAKATFPEASITVAKSQGYCSYTVYIGDDDKVLQFRPASFKIAVETSTQARGVLGDLVPGTKAVATLPGLPLDHNDASPGCLHVYLLDKVPGVTLTEFQERLRHDERQLLKSKRRLVQDLGVVFAKSYLSAQIPQRPPLAQRGRVGSSFAWRLDLLRNHLASEDVRAVVAEVHQALEDVKELPWCLTHGDLVPANIMVDAATGQLTGLIDWAEGEHLPFGVGLYGLEEVLGMEDAVTGVFEYHSPHHLLRGEFWKSFNTYLHQRRCSLTTGEWDAVVLARKLGILLWRGIAFEDGRIDRVVEKGIDDGELRKLELFLGVEDAVPRCKRKGMLGWLWRCFLLFFTTLCIP